MNFSVIVPAFESARFIGDALSSALKQTVPPHEVIVVDDGSTDHLLEAIEPFREEIVFVQQDNRGPGAARNAGLARATGDWIVLLDADDWWEVTRLEAIRRHSTMHPNLSLITTDAMLAGDSGPVRYYSRTRFAYEQQRAAILCSNFIFISAAMPRSLMVELGGFSEDRRITEDWDMWIRAILAGGEAGLVEEPLAYYRIHTGNATSNRVAVHLGDALVLERALEVEQISDYERRLAMGRKAMATFDAAILIGSAVRRAGFAVARSSSLSPRMRLAGAVAVASPTLSTVVSRRR